MYAVIRKYKFDNAYSAALDAKIERIFKPAVEKTPGFICYYWLTDSKGGGCSVSVFETQSGAEESVAKAADFVKAELSEMGFSAPEVFMGEVKSHAESDVYGIYDEREDHDSNDRPIVHGP